MSKKFELTWNTKDHFGITLYQIRALKDFNNISKGDLGGWVEKEENLSQDGLSWISGNARVHGNAWVYGDALVSGNAGVYGNALVSGNAWVSGNARVYGDALVYGNALVSGDADFLVFDKVGSRNDTLTAFKTRKNDQEGIGVVVGCFQGTLEEFEEAIKKTHGDNRFGKMYQIAIGMIKFKLS